MKRKPSNTRFGWLLKYKEVNIFKKIIIKIQHLLYIQLKIFLTTSNNMTPSSHLYQHLSLWNDYNGVWTNKMDKPHWANHRWISLLVHSFGPQPKWTNKGRSTKLDLKHHIVIQSALIKDGPLQIQLARLQQPKTYRKRCPNKKLWQIGLLIDQFDPEIYRFAFRLLIYRYT